MATTDAIQRRLDTAEDLRTIVRTMKALAAVNIRQYEEAVVSLAEYARSVELGFEVLLRNRSQPPRVASSRQSADRVGAIVLGSDHGLCGSFNEQVTAFYLERQPASARAGGEPLMAIGLRAAGRLEDLGRRPDEVLTLPGSVARVAAVVREVIERVSAWRAAGSVEAVRLYFNAPQEQAGYQPREEQLLPLDEERLLTMAARPWRPRATPAVAGDWDTLFSAVVRQHLFVTVHRAIALSLASENASRLAAMHAAERNIDERLHILRGQFHRERQTAITTELLDIVAGYEALTGRTRRPGR